MALKTFVKISNINNLSDARYCAGMGVEQLGFCIEKDNPNYVSPGSFKQMSEWLSGVDYVAEFSSYSTEDIKNAIAEYEIQYIQTSQAEQLPELSKLDLPLILQIDPANSDITEISELISFAASYVDYFIFESVSTISNHLFSLLLELGNNYEIVIGTGVSLESLNPILKSNVKGFALKGGNEIKPGLKDFAELADILEACEVED